MRMLTRANKVVTTRDVTSEESATNVWPPPMPPIEIPEMIAEEKAQGNFDYDPPPPLRSTGE